MSSDRKCRDAWDRIFNLATSGYSIKIHIEKDGLLIDDTYYNPGEDFDKFLESVKTIANDIKTEY